MGWVAGGTSEEDGGMSDENEPTTWHALAPHIWTRIGDDKPVMVRNDMPFSIIVGIADDGRIIAAEGDRFSVRGPEDD